MCCCCRPATSNIPRLVEGLHPTEALLRTVDSQLHLPPGCTVDTDCTSRYYPNGAIIRSLPSDTELPSQKLGAASTDAVVVVSVRLVFELPIAPSGG